MPDPHSSPRPIRRSLRLLALSALLAPLSPDTFAAADQTTQRVHDFLLEQLGADAARAQIEVHQPGAVLPPCKEPQPFLPQANQRLLGRIAIGVRCAGESIRYLQASVAIVSDYLVAARPIAAGEVLAGDMLERRQGDLSRLPRNTLTDPAQAVGMQASRALSEGSPLLGNALRAPQLVERNARVKIEARGRGFSISREGVALDNGSLNSEIRVRTDDGETLRARVVGVNRLEVHF